MFPAHNTSTLLDLTAIAIDRLIVSKFTKEGLVLILNQHLEIFLRLLSYNYHFTFSKLAPFLKYFLAQVAEQKSTRSKHGPAGETNRSASFESVRPTVE